MSKRLILFYLVVFGTLLVFALVILAQKTW